MRRREREGTTLLVPGSRLHQQRRLRGQEEADPGNLNGEFVADATGTPDPYTPPKPGDFRSETHLQVGPIMQYVTSLVKAHEGEVEPAHHGMHHMNS